MPFSLSEDVATLTGVVTVDDAEPLAQWLRDTTAANVRLAECTHLHTSALQALMAGRPHVTAPPTDPFLARWIMPLLTAPSHSQLNAPLTDRPPTPIISEGIQ